MCAVGDTVVVTADMCGGPFKGAVGIVIDSSDEHGYDWKVFVHELKEIVHFANAELAKVDVTVIEGRLYRTSDGVPIVHDGETIHVPFANIVDGDNIRITIEKLPQGVK